MGIFKDKSSTLSSEEELKYLAAATILANSGTLPTNKAILVAINKANALYCTMFPESNDEVDKDQLEKD